MLVCRERLPCPEALNPQGGTRVPRVPDRAVRIALCVLLRSERRGLWQVCVADDR